MIVQVISQKVKVSVYKLDSALASGACQKIGLKSTREYLKRGLKQQYINCEIGFETVVIAGQTIAKVMEAAEIYAKL